MGHAKDWVSTLMSVLLVIPVSRGEAQQEKKVQTNKDKHKQLEVQSIQIKANNALIETNFTEEIVLCQTHSNIEFTSFPWHVTMELFHWFNTWKIKNCLKSKNYTKKMRKATEVSQQALGSYAWLQEFARPENCEQLQILEQESMIHTINTYLKNQTICRKSQMQMTGQISMCSPSSVSQWSQ